MDIQVPSLLFMEPNATIFDLLIQFYIQKYVWINLQNNRAKQN